MKKSTYTSNHPQRAYEQRDTLAWMIHRITGSESAPPMFVAMDWSPTGK